MEVDVRGTGRTELGVEEELDVEEDVEDLVGDSVTVGSTVDVTVEPTTPLRVKNQYHARPRERTVHLQPWPSQILPGMQHPPPVLPGQDV